MNSQEPAKAETYWQDAAGQKWARLQTRTDAQLGPLGLAAMDALELQPGERVLDVGCGAGDTLLELAARVGVAGSVVGLDISGPLLERARERVRESGQEQIELLLGNAATQSFETSFDVVFSRFGVMFFEDAAAAFASLRRAMRPGARLGFVCWQKLEKNPWADQLLRAVTDVCPTQPLPALLAPGAPGPFRFSDPALVKSILTEAGFEQVSIADHDVEVAFGGTSTLEEAVDFALEIGPAARFVADADPALAPRFRDALRAALAPYVTERGVWTPASTFIVTAKSRR